MWPQCVEEKQTLQQTAKTDFDGCVFEIMNQSPDELCRWFDEVFGRSDPDRG